MDKQEYRATVKKLNDSTIAYYQGCNVNLLPDMEYDLLYGHIKDYELNSGDIVPESPTQRIGENVTGRDVVPHDAPMMSLDNAFAELDFSAFIDRVYEETNQSVFCVEPKYDGLAGSLVYKNGLLSIAKLRGDGKAGEDITANAKAVSSVPVRIDTQSPVEVRGEFILPKDAFSSLNERAIASGRDAYINPRNAVAGIMRNYNPKIVKDAGVIFISYDLLSENDFELQSDAQECLTVLGFKCAETLTVDGLESALDAYNEMLEKRPYMPFEIDGCVFKLNDRKAAKAAGSTAQFPKTSIAFKFPPEEVLSRVLDVDFQVGRTGAITPVARIEPAFVGGVTVSNVSLHNSDEIQRLGIYKGCRVYVRRAGDVIPQITGVYIDDSVEEKTPVAFPTHCPACGTALIKESEDHVKIHCPNSTSCKPQLINGILHFVSRKAMNIDGVGEVLATKMVESSAVEDISDIPWLRYKDCEWLRTTLELGTVEVENLLKELNKVVNPDLHRFILALGIRDIGESTAINLAKHFGSIDGFIAGCEEDIDSLITCRIPEVGPVAAKRLYSWMQQNYRIIKMLRKGGYEPNVVVAPSNLPLSGKTIVITGSFGKTKRDDIKATLRGLGATVSGSVSKNTDILLCGENAGEKLAEANKLGVTVVTATGNFKSAADLIHLLV